MYATRKCRPGTKAQRGQTFLIMVLLIVVGAGALIYNMASPGRIAIERDQQTHAALAQAKDALIGYAAGLQSGGTGRPGNLPCPDILGFGSQGGNCNSDGVRIGRLPWKTLGLSELRDGHGEPLWYAVSDNFKNSTATGILNIDTPGNLTVNGTSPATNVIAIVFAPGPVVGSQDRNPNVTLTCATTGTPMKNHLCATNFLEGGNENADTIFVSGPATTTFNDKLLLITGDALFPPVEMRVAREARIVLRTFYSNHNFFPFANAYSDTSFECTNNQLSGRIPRFFNNNCKLLSSDPAWKNGAFPSWFFPNNWHHVLFYAVASKCAEPISPACGASGGMLTVNSMPPPNNDKRVLIIAPGRALAGQARPCASVTDCLEDAENTNGDSTYTGSAVTSTANDRLVVVSP